MLSIGIEPNGNDSGVADCDDQSGTRAATSCNIALSFSESLLGQLINIRDVVYLDIPSSTADICTAHRRSSSNSENVEGDNLTMQCTIDVTSRAKGVKEIEGRIGRAVSFRAFRENDNRSRIEGVETDADEDNDDTEDETHRVL